MLLEASSLQVDFDRFRAVDRVDLQLREGELLGIAGTNGAGKSTVFGAIAGQVKLSSGALRFAGTDITHMPVHRRARLGLARTFQVPREFGQLSVRDNLLAAARNDQHETLFAAWFSRRAAHHADVQLLAEADRWLALTGLQAQADVLASRLSGGQKKLLELSRALMTRPRCILLDEPFAGVNPVLIDRLIEVLRAVHSEGIALIIIEHHLQALKSLVERLVVMDQGRIIAQGSPSTVLADPRVAEAYMGGVV